MAKKKEIVVYIPMFLVAGSETILGVFTEMARAQAAVIEEVFQCREQKIDLTGHEYYIYKWTLNNDTYESVLEYNQDTEEWNESKY